MAGYRREELIGKSVTQFYYDLNERVEFIEQVSKKGEVWDFEALLRTKSGQIKYTSFNAHLLFDSNGQNIGIEGTLRDIDERKQAEIQLQKAKEKAEESDRLKSAFLQNISHEIRTPMNAILGFTSLLGNTDTGSEMQASFVKAIQKSSKQLFSIINDIVDVSSIEANLINKNLTIFNLNSVLNNLYTEFKTRTSENNISFNLRSGLADDLSMIQTDKVRLIQVISNLLNNAFKFTRNGQIEFGYITKNSKIEFFVSDTGIGIDPAFHLKVFNSFFQVENSLSRTFSGTGLGLSICKAYVELLGGKIWLVSEPKKGSVFFFDIPFDTSFIPLT
jgi:signal transduction histidine kinase